MPARDGTGPFGEGMLTGRGMGPCGDYEGYGGYGGRGYGRPGRPGRLGRFGGFRRFGGGRPYGGFRRFGGGGYGRFGGFGGFWSGPGVSEVTGWDENDKETLKEEREYLKSRLDQIDKELEK